MKLISPIFGLSNKALLAGLLMIPAVSQAAELAYEGFDYPTGSGNLSGQNGGSGWNGAWMTVNNGSADVVAGSLLAGSSAPADFDLRSTGNNHHLPNNRRVGRKLDTSLTGPFASRRDANGRIGADGTTVYVSFLQQPNGTSAYYEFEFHRGDLGDPGRIAGIGNDQAGNNVNLRAPNGTHTFVGTGSSSVNFYVVRIDFLLGNDNVFVYQNPASLTEPGVPTLTRLGAADMSFDGISFGAFNNGRTVMHDEVRLGETWADVTVPAVSPPVFTRQPRASSTGFVGGGIVLEARAEAYPLPTYQWFKGAVPIDGQTGSTLTLNNLQTVDAGVYHVVATNSQNSATSQNAQVVVLAAPPGLLAYEGFDYNTGTGNLAGKAGGIGWGAAWANVNAGGGNILSGNLAAGTNAPNGYDTQSLGNSAFMPNGQRDGRVIDTSPTGRFGTAGYVDGSGNIGADGKTIYISFLQQPDGTPLFYEFEFHRGNLGDPGRIGGVGNDTAAANVALRTGGTSTFIGAGSTAVNFYVVRIDFQPGNDDVYVYQNPISATEPAAATLSMFAVSDMSFNGISLAAFANGRTVKHDEIRLGQSWSDVVFGTSRRELTWVGDGVSNNWNFLSNNWGAGSGPTAFVNGDPVMFDDGGSTAPAINIPATVETSTVDFQNFSNNYTLSGVGTINASGGLTKSGNGSLTLNAPANFGAAMVIEEGDLTLNGTTNVGGDLNLNFGAGAVTLAGTSAFTGSMNITAGTQTLSGTNSFRGLVSVSGSTTISGPTSVTGTGGTNVWIGNLSGANASLTLEAGGSLDITGVFGDALVLGRDGGSAAVIQNGGTLTYNPSNRDSAFIGASESGATVASYAMNGGTLEMSNKRLGLSIGPIVSELNQTAGSIKVRQLDLGANLPTGTGNYTMTGGTLTIGAGGITSASGLYEIKLANGTVAAAADWSSLLIMNLTDDITFDTGVHTINLGGTLSGAGGLTKTGTGTLVLTPLNGHTGPTLVSSGAIAGLGSGDFSPLTVSPGASVRPGIPGNVGVNIGNFYGGNTVTLAPGSSLELEIDSALGTIDQLTAFDALAISGANVSFSDPIGAVIPPGTTLVIAESLAATRTGTFAGYPEGATVSAGVNSFIISYTDTQVILTATGGSAYSSWASSAGLDGTPGKDPAFDADPESDGLANGLEWILGGNPLASDAGALITATGSATGGLTVSFTRKEDSLGNADLILQWDADLDGTWTDVAITQAGGSHANGVVVTVDTAASPDGVSVQIPASNGPDGKVFARLRAVMP
jgi:autotransporter-associated beta strand protein